MGLFDSLIEQLRDEEIDSLAAPNMGDLGLQEVVELLRRVRRELELGNAMDDLDLTDQARSTLLGGNLKNQLDSLMNSMRTYGPNSNNPAQERGSMLQQARALKDSVLTTLKPLVVTDGEELRRAMQELARLRAEIDSRVEQLGKQQEAVAQASNESATGDLSREYREQADRHAKAAGRFVIGAVVSGFVLAGVAVVLYRIGVPKALSTYGAVRDGAVRVLVLALLTLVVAFCLRNYRVNRHLEILNRRRQHALTTFGLFQAAVTSEEARNVVVTELVQAVFAHEPTGYVTTSGDAGGADSNASILGLLAAQVRSREP